MKKVLKQIEESKGKFMGVWLTNGQAINAKYVKPRRKVKNPKTVLLYDNNAKKLRRVCLSKIAQVS